MQELQVVGRLRRELGCGGHRPCVIAVAVALALGLSACGGGGGGNAQSSPPTPPPVGGSDFTGGDVLVGANDVVVWPANIGGSIDLIKGGTGTLVLTGTDTYTGGTTINQGTLQLGNGGTTGSIIGDVTDNGILAFDRSNELTFNGAVSGSGSLTQAGTGTLILTGANTYTGGTTISNGTLQLGNGGTTGWITGNVTDNGTLAIKRSDDVIFSDIISGRGSLMQAGTGKLILTGDNTYTGGTTISNGTLQIGNFGTAGWITGNVRNNGSLVFGRSDDVTFNGIISGSGSLVKTGDGTLTVTGANTYTGGTTVAGGTLEIVPGAALGTGSIAVGNYGPYYFSDHILQVDSGASLSNQIVLGGSGTLDNAGTLGGSLNNAVSGSVALATVLNHDGGSITGQDSAISIDALGTVKNSSGGVIDGANLAVGLGGGGQVSNDGTDSIIRSANGFAVYISGQTGTVENTGGGTITGGSTASYLQHGGTGTNGSGSTIETTGTTGGDCAGTGACSIFVASADSTSSTLDGGLTLTNAGTIIGNVQMIPTARNSVTLSVGGSIRGDLDMGSNASSFLTLNGDAGTSQLYSQAVTGTTTFAGALSKSGNGTWIIDKTLDTVDHTVIAGGTMQVGSGGTEGSIGQGNIQVYSGARLVFDRSDVVTYTGLLTGPLVQAGTGTLILTAGVPISDITIQQGTLQIGDGGALRSGSGDITNNGLLIFDHSDEVPFYNVISGTGSLTQEGTGTLTLYGVNTYTGDTTVNGGTLRAVNTLPGNVIVNTGAVLDGASYDGLPPGVFQVAGNLSNAGTVAVHGRDSTVVGDYVQSSTGTLAISLGSTLEVTGADSGYVSNTHTNVLTASGSRVIGTFDNLVKDAGVVFTATTINYDANSVWLDTTGLDVTTAAAGHGVSYTAASMGSAQRVQAAFEQLNASIAAGKPSGVSSGFLQAAGQFQQAPTLQAAQASLQSLSGQLHAASAAMTFQAIDASSRALSDRFDNLLDKGTGFGMWSHSLSVGGGMARAGFNDVGFQLNGWLVGNDSKIGLSGVAGYAFGQSQGQQQLDQSYDHDNSRSTEGMMYAGWLNGNWYTQGRVGFGHFQQAINRRVLLGDSTQGVGTQYNGSYDVVYGESGLHFGPGNSRVTPIVNVQYARIGRDGFAEQGAGGFGLQSNAQMLDRWQAGLGVRAARHWDLDGGRAVDFSARAQWQSTLASHGDVLDASFVGLQQWQPLDGIGLSRYSGVFGAAVDATLSAHTTLNFNYDYEMGQHVHAQIVSAHMNVAF